MTLRLAEERDLEEVVRMARMFHKSSPYASMAFSEERLIDFFQIYLADKTKMIVILSEQDGKPRGMIVGMADSPHFSDEKAATELAWWMDEEYRRGRDSIDLMKAYEEWARRIGATVTQMALLSSSPDVSKLYEKSGYSLTERTYVKWQHSQL